MLAGDWASAHDYLEQGIALYDPRQHRAHAFIYGGHDPGVCCLGANAWSLWVLGYPDQALRRSQETLALARELSHPTTLAHAQQLIGIFHQFRREALETQDLAEALERLAAEQGLPTYLATGSLLRGWALAAGGLGEEGIAKIHEGLAASTSSAPYWRPYFQVFLAEAYGKRGDSQKGFAVLAEAMRQFSNTRMGFGEPEVYRVQGELLLACAPEISADAEACFRQAIAVARHQNARSWELRAVLSLSRLYHHQGKNEEARRMLAEIYGWFTEGFETADLQEAKAMLQVLS